MSTIEFEGASYDLTEFSHPGGTVIHGAYLTDATAIIHSYHPDMDRIRRAIAPYRVGKAENADKYKGPLYAELKRRVYAALKENSESHGADFALKFKMVFILVSYILSFMWLFFSPTPFYACVASVSLGVTGAMVGMNVMHDASHMAIERGPWLMWNYVWQLSGDMIGLSTLGWRYQHVIQHHIQTDNPGDPDAAFVYPIIRSSPDQPHLPIHYLQGLLLLPVTHMLIVLFQVFDTVHTLTGIYTYEGLRKPAGTTHTKREWAQFFLAKICLAIQWGVLWYKGGFAAWALFCVCGSFVLSSIDVPGHFTTHPSLAPFDKLPKSIQEGDAIDSWLLEQLHHTNTFAPGLNGLFGGLNMQIEHHLFPRVSHRHYPFMRPIVKEFCQENNLPYNDYTLFGALYATLERLVALSVPPKKEGKKVV